MTDKPGLPALPKQTIPPDLVEEMAMDIGKAVAAYVEHMFPEAVEAAHSSGSFLLSLRNCVYNEIIAAMDAGDIGEIEQRLARRKRERRKLRAISKADRTINLNTPPETMDAIMADIKADRLPLEPDL